MSLFDRKERKKIEKIEEGVSEYFNVFSAYTPAYRTYEGGVYEMDLTRAAIHAKANHCSKLKPIVSGSGNQGIERTLQYQPNPLMDTKKYLYRLATMTFVHNNAYIAPLIEYSTVNGKAEPKVVGFYPLHPAKCEIKNIDGKMWLIYEMEQGKKSAIEFERCGRLNQFQNKSELFGESNKPMFPTLQLMDSQNQAIVEAVKNSSNIRFLAKLGQSLRQEDVDKERQRFVKSNLSNNGTGVMLIDAKYADVKQLESKQFTLDDKQMALIKQNVFDYFGVSENILQGNYSSTEFNSFYESQIEPWALEMSLQHTKMLFTPHEVAFGNHVEFTANRFNFLSSSEKVNVIQILFDRGLLTPNEAREIINMSDIPNGNNFYIRKEYTDTTEAVSSEEVDNDTNGQDEE